MTAVSDLETARDTLALFARISRSSDRVILSATDAASPTTSSSPAFYCVHSVSGAAGTDFLDLARRLEPTIRFYGIQAPPKQMLDFEFGKSMESLASYYSDALCEFQPSGPLVLGGYCVGAVIALEMAKNLRARGREVGPLIAIDGTPENAGERLHRWQPRYWLELARNIPSWIGHADLMRSLSLRSFLSSLSKNLSAVGTGMVGLKRGEKLGGSYAMDRIMDLSLYPPFHRKFINRLFNALFAYIPQEYSGEVAVYEAQTTPLLYLPQVARTWRNFAPHSDIVSVAGTHIAMMHEPYVDALAEDMRRRILTYIQQSSAASRPI